MRPLSIGRAEGVGENVGVSSHKRGWGRPSSCRVSIPGSKWGGEEEKAVLNKRIVLNKRVQLGGGCDRRLLQ